MRKSSILFIFLSLLVFDICYAENEKGEDCFKVDKHYCSREQIELTDDAIFVRFKNDVVEVDTLFADQGGLYFTEDKMRCTSCRRPLNPKNTCEHTLNFWQ